MKRCPYAIKAGITLTTRCMEDDSHLLDERNHVGKGLAEFPYQRIEWLPGDRREFITERDDEFAWEEV